MAIPQMNTISLLGAGEARFDGAGAVIVLATATPTWTSLASTAAWASAFAVPTAAGITQYVTHADFYVEGGAIFVTRVASPTNVPTVANGFKWPVGYAEMLRNSPEMLRSMQFFIPNGASLWVTLYWGTL